MPSDLDQAYNDFFRASEFYAIGRRLTTPATRSSTSRASRSAGTVRSSRPRGQATKTSTPSRGVHGLVSVYTEPRPRPTLPMSEERREKHRRAMLATWARWRAAGGKGKVGRCEA